MLVSMNDMDANRVVLAALDELKQAYASIEAVLAADEDLDRAFAAASKWTEALRRYTNSSAELRSQLAMEIRDKNGLSLAALADRVGISKARAAQLVKSPKADGETASPSADMSAS
jgi:hypothetical protein